MRCILLGGLVLVAVLALAQCGTFFAPAFRSRVFIVSPSPSGGGVSSCRRQHSWPSMSPAASSRNATRRNARHRRAQEFRTIFTSVPKRFHLHVRNRQCFSRILKHATVRKSVALEMQNFKLRSGAFSYTYRLR